MSVDFGALSPADWLVGVGALAILLGAFLPWFSSTTGTGARAVTKAQSGWDLTSVGRVVALVGLVALALFIARLLKVRLPFALPWSDRSIYLALGIEVLILGILWFADYSNPLPVNVKGLSAGPAFGLFLTLLGALALAGGAYLMRHMPGMSQK
jgi:hypothetical protein